MSYNLLFLCTGNSARSIIAEALLNRLGEGRFTAYSAGSQPRGEVNPHALAITRTLGFRDDEFRSKSWDEFARPGAPVLDFVITVCDDAAEEVCPVWPGQPTTAHWGVSDPARASGSEAEIAAAFADACRMLRRRIELFLELPMEKVDRLSIHRRMVEIGKSTDAPVR